MFKIFCDVFKKFRVIFIVIFILTVITHVSVICIPHYNGKFLNALIDRDVYRIKVNASLVVAFTIINLLSGLFETLFASKLQEKAKFYYKSNCLKHLRNIPLLKYKKFNPVYLNQRLEQDVTTVMKVIIENFSTCIVYVPKFFVITYMLFLINIKVTVIILLMMPLYLCVYIKFKGTIYNNSMNTRELQNIYFKDFEEQLDYMEYIKINSNFEEEDYCVEKSFEKYYKTFRRYMNVVVGFNSLDGVISIIFQVIAFVIGGYSVINGDMTVGELAVVGNYYGMMEKIIKYYYGMGKDYQVSLSAIGRLKELEEIDEESHGLGFIDSIENISGIVNFSYSKEIKLLDQIRINMQKGYIYGICGENGAGKSTLLQLIIGILRGDTDDSGDSNITYNNISVKDLNMHKIRKKNISYIPQKIKIRDSTLGDYFSIIENIDSDSDIRLFFESMECPLNENMNFFFKDNWNRNINELSIGDRQFIYVIFEILKEKDCIIFDEPTSNLDINRMEWLMKFLKRNKKNHLYIVISHDKRFLSIAEKKIEVTKYTI